MLDEINSKRITSLRYLLICFVVFIHANLTPDNAINYYHYDFAQPYWIEVFKNIVCGTLGEAAVPLFFFFASILQFSKADTYPALLKKRSKSLFLPYVLWTFIAILMFFVGQSIPQTADFFNNPINVIKNWNYKDWFGAFTYYDSDDNLRLPFVYQFWFLRDLMIFIILSPLLKLLCEKLSAILPVFVFIAALREIPLGFTVSSRALFFYLAGYYTVKYEIDIFKIADKVKLYEYIVLFILAVVFDVCFAGKYRFGFIGTLISCLFFLKISGYFIRNQKLYSKLDYLSGFSFFLYAVHAPFLGTAINKISQKIIPLHGILTLVQFLAAGILTIILGTLYGMVLKTICPPIFAFLTGGRIARGNKETAELNRQTS
ncbi:acyltransferase [Treponema parvum]|uniref:Acyltransferase n=1 Tax=Treponema parvum TaxID=138851 RepID=A0A975F4U8_9SPIR|nr:acyltransferase [Treponema parvum]QTQ14410.1 acyltransferase [Treponema parvum]